MTAWFSKKQSTVETSMFGAEFCAMKYGIENLCGICYKLRMMGVPIKGPPSMYGDNMSIVTNVSRSELMLRKKSNLICYHAVREAVAMGKALVAHIPTKKNLADLFNEVLYGRTRSFLLDRMLWDVVPSRLTLREPSGQGVANDWSLSLGDCDVISQSVDCQRVFPVAFCQGRQTDGDCHPWGD
jgi:hypothetical protein